MANKNGQESAGEIATYLKKVLGAEIKNSDKVYIYLSSVRRIAKLQYASYRKRRPLYHI